MSILRINQTHTLSNPPKIKHAMCHVPNLGIVAQGDVLTRPTNLIYKHFGIAYGLDENNVLWFLEFNQDGVRYVTLADFLAGETKMEKEEYPNLDWSIITVRAKKFDSLEYQARKRNCENFVNYIFKLEDFSKQSEDTEFWFETITKAVVSYRNIGKSEEERNKNIILTNNLMKNLGLTKQPPLEINEPKKKKLDFSKFYIQNKPINQSPNQNSNSSPNPIISKDFKWKKG